MSTSERERKRFERWYTRRNPLSKHELARDPESPFPYLDNRVNACWHAWKASRREVVSIINAARNLTDSSYDYLAEEKPVQNLRNELERYDHEGITNDTE